jgi:hypothetical protein
VTIPPLQMSKSVATQVSHAKRFSQIVDLSGSSRCISKKITADYADFADGLSVAVDLWAIQHQLFFTSARRFAQRSGYS